MNRIPLILLGLIVSLGLVGGAVAAKKKTETLTVEWDLQVYDDKGKPTVCSGDADHLHGALQPDSSQRIDACGNLF
jgi:hypothetical protein